MSVEQAAEFIATLACYPKGFDSSMVADSRLFLMAYKTAAKICHPDADSAVDSETWQKLQVAKAVLETHFNAKAAGGAV